MQNTVYTEVFSNKLQYTFSAWCHGETW